jgi:hypothetical protein
MRSCKEEEIEAVFRQPVLVVRVPQKLPSCRDQEPDKKFEMSPPGGAIFTAV